jgi:DNA-directed RNA polymerase subunit B"
MIRTLCQQEVKLTGDLMEDLFRVAFNRLAGCKFQIERANMRNV